MVHQILWHQLFRLVLLIRHSTTATTLRTRWVTNPPHFGFSSGPCSLSQAHPNFHINRNSPLAHAQKVIVEGDSSFLEHDDDARTSELEDTHFFAFADLGTRLLPFLMDPTCARYKIPSAVHGASSEKHILDSSHVCSANGYE